MISLKKRTQGFTIVELLIVIVVIGILAALVITTYAGIQSKARDAKRQTDIQAVQTQVEAFYSQNGYYPSNADLNSSTWLTTNMKSLDTNALIDPSNNGSGTVLSTPATASSTPPNRGYAYQPLDSSGTTTNCNSTTDSGCVSYTLTGYLENNVSGSQNYVKKNLD